MFGCGMSIKRNPLILIGVVVSLVTTVQMKTALPSILIESGTIILAFILISSFVRGNVMLPLAQSRFQVQLARPLHSNLMKQKRMALANQTATVMDKELVQQVGNVLVLLVQLLNLLLLHHSARVPRTQPAQAGATLKLRTSAQPVPFTVHGVTTSDTSGKYSKFQQEFPNAKSRGAAG